MRQRFLALVLSSLLSITACGQTDSKKHPIDAKLEKLEQNALSTAEQRDTQIEGLKLWDAEMNRVYTKLRNALKPAASKALEVAQRAWLRYRESEVKFLDQMYQEFEGTMYIPMHAAAVKEITRARALELTHLLMSHEEAAY